MRKLILLILLSAHTGLYSQNKRNADNFIEIVGVEEGDLNKDNVADKMIATTIKTGEIRPFRFQIFLSQPGSKKLKLVVSTTKLFETQYPIEKNRKQKNFRIPDFFIENGKLTILTDVNDLHSRYVFRFNNGDFELYSIERIILVKNGVTKETEINLLKGIKIEYDQDYDKVFNKRKKYIGIKDLPKIQNLTFSDLESF